MFTATGPGAAEAAVGPTITCDDHDAVNEMFLCRRRPVHEMEAETFIDGCEVPGGERQTLAIRAGHPLANARALQVSFTSLSPA